MKKLIAAVLLTSLLVVLVLPGPCRASKASDRDLVIVSGMFVTLFAHCLTSSVAHMIVDDMVKEFSSPESAAEWPSKEKIYDNACIWLAIGGLAYMITGEKELGYIIPVTLFYISF